ncbi:hypothetical protein RAS1_23530 [Phycisphaerae bacterium RAS1]|nr:hypothetical protein RAS1_23530 [Phycisphaerae bacterium RAS1]
MADADIHVLELTKLSWSTMGGDGPRPALTQDASLTHDPKADALLLVGGLTLDPDGAPGTRSLWIFDLRRKRWMEHERFFSNLRRDHVAVYDSRNFAHLIHGGCTPTEAANFYMQGQPLRDVLVLELVRQ